MCKFFSCVTKGDGDLMYFNWEQRKKINSGKLKVESADSHTSIADYYGFKSKKEDRLNKYEYNPLTKKIEVDQINTTDDQKIVKAKLRVIDWKDVVEPLIIKPFVHPYKDRKALKVTDGDIYLLKRWDSVRNSVRDSVRDSVRGSVGNSVGNSVWDSVWDSVWNSIWDSAWDSLYAYISTFFNIPYAYDFSSATELWEKGLVSAYDGEFLRLHGYEGKELFKITKDELKVWEG